MATSYYRFSTSTVPARKDVAHRPACGTKRRNSGNMFNSRKNIEKPQKARFKTGDRPTSAKQQNRQEAHEQGPKQPATATHTGAAETTHNKQHPAALSATEQKHERKEATRGLRPQPQRRRRAIPWHREGNRAHSRRRHRRRHTNNTTRTTLCIPCSALQHQVLYNYLAIQDPHGITEDTGVALKMPRVPQNMQRQLQAACSHGPRYLQVAPTASTVKVRQVSSTKAAQQAHRPCVGCFILGMAKGPFK